MDKKQTENVVFHFVFDNNDHCPLSRLPKVGCIMHMSFCLICHFSRPHCSSWCDAFFDLPTWLAGNMGCGFVQIRGFGLSGWHIYWCRKRWRKWGISNWLVLLAWFLSFSLVYPSCRPKAHHCHVRMLWLVHSTSRGCDHGGHTSLYFVWTRALKYILLLSCNTKMGQKIYSFFFMSRYIWYLLHSKKMVTKIEDLFLK